YRNAAALFPWSNWAADSMINDYGADPSRVHVIPPGVVIDDWATDRSIKNPSEKVHILFVGGEFFRKGGDLLLDWAATTKLKNWHLHLVTQRKVINTDTRVTVHNGLSPNDPALMQLFRDADIFALPTRGDCYSIAAIEAMATGLPVILSLTGGTGDIIRDGVTGYLIEPENVVDLKEKLETLIADPEARFSMGLAARQDVEARYDATRNIQQTLTIMRKTLGQ
ncbi:MAG: glycosyltransferase family 4 protein, partial [Chthonomonadales bacterium]